MTSSKTLPMVTSQLAELVPTADTVHQPYKTANTAEYTTFSTESSSETSTNNGNSVGQSSTSNSVSSFHSRAYFRSTTLHVADPTQGEMSLYYNQVHNHYYCFSGRWERVEGGGGSVGTTTLCRPWMWFEGYGFP